MSSPLKPLLILSLISSIASGASMKSKYDAMLYGEAKEFISSDISKADCDKKYKEDVLARFCLFGAFIKKGGYKPYSFEKFKNNPPFR